MKKVVILGSTGSIGKQALSVIRRNPDKFSVLGLVANTSAELLSRQANEFHPKYVGLVDSNSRNALDLNYKCQVICGESVLKDFAALDECDLVLCAVVGMSGFSGVVSAIEHKKQIALANKEVLVAGGEFITSLCQKYGVELLPVDSEHSAVWQCLSGRKSADVKEIILTASGGPFRDIKDRSALALVSAEQAVAHPNWKMGKKISVDSATMMNKGLEIIEAKWLFGIENINYVIHPQSIIHSMIRLVDGSLIAQMSNPSMELPIQIALNFPERIKSDFYDFNFDQTLSFSAPNETVFPLPRLAKESIKIGKDASCILNAANEAAVRLFLDRKIGFLDIFDIVENTMNISDFREVYGYNDIIAVHTNTYERVMRDFS